MTVRTATIMGIDPGTHSLGVCVLKDGHVSKVYQRELRKAERTVDHAEEWRRMVMRFVWEVKPDAVGIEIIEPQPWRTGGRIPKGLVRMSSLVNQMSLDLADEGVLVYPQSPGIQGNYDDFVVDSMVRKAMGKDFAVSRHLRSATKHALRADSFYRDSMARRNSRG